MLLFWWYWIVEFNLESILVYNISYKNLIVAKPLGIRLDKTELFIEGCDGARYLVLFESEKYDYNRIIYLIGVKSGIRYVTSHDDVKIKVDSYNSLPLQKSNEFS